MRFIVAGIALWVLLCVSAVPSPAEESTAISVPHRESHEGSSLLKVENAPLLQALGWKRAFWVAFDERKDGGPLGLLGQKADGTWELRNVPVTPEKGHDDAEALARKDGFVYLVGSHFGKKKGKLDADRQFVARFRESEIQGTSPAVVLELRRDDFELHRLLNDALAQQKIDLIARGPKEKEEYIEKTRKSDEPGKDRVQENDRALNIEGATFLDSGQLALGLRYPVTKQGEPLVLVLEDVDSLFQNQQDKLPKVVAIWTLQGAGTPAQLRGIRALDLAGGEIQAIVGSIERSSEESPLLKDHPGADKVTAEHRAFTVPALEAKAVCSRQVRDLDPADNVEGISVEDGGDWYLFDQKDQVRIRHEARPQAASQRP